MTTLPRLLRSFDVTVLLRVLGLALAVVFGCDGHLLEEPAYVAASKALGTPLPSCSEAARSGYTTSGKKLVLALEVATTNQVTLTATGGEIRVNNYACLTPAGTKLRIGDVSRIEVNGTALDDLVIVDLVFGPFGTVMTAGNITPTGIVLDLAAGSNDSVEVRGTGLNDTITFGSDGVLEYADFTGDGRADLLAANAERITVAGASGADTLSGQGRMGTRTLVVPSGLLATPGAIGPTSLPMRLYGGAGNDTLTGGNGDDTLDGMEGDDTLVASGTTGSDGNDAFVGGDGRDTVDYGARATNTYLSIGHDRTSATSAGAACDTANVNHRGDDGAYDATGQLECDDVDTTVENLNGGAGTDVLIGSTSSNTIRGGAGSDYLWGGPAGACSTTQDVDVLNGEEGDDVFVPLLAAGASAADCRDTFNGGPGVDAVLYTFRTNAVTASANAGATSGESGEGDTLGTDIEIVFGGQGNDTLAAGVRAAWLFGCEGDDTLTGGTGDDVLVGGPGNDLMNGLAGSDRFVEKGSVARVIAGAREGSLPVAYDAAIVGCASSSGTSVANGAGSDRMNGGIGTEDTVDYGGLALALGSFSFTDHGPRTAALTVTLCASSASTSSVGAATSCTSGTAGGDGESGENDDVINVTRVYGGDGDDLLTGAATHDALYGYGGDDQLNGGEGCDTLVGGAHGNAESNVLVGGGGDDVCLEAGSGVRAQQTTCELRP